MGIDYYKAYVAYMRLTSEPLLMDNPQCVKKIVNTMYWEAIAAIDKDKEDNQIKYIILAVAIGVVFILSLALFTVYFRRKSSVESKETTEPKEETTESKEAAEPLTNE